MTSRTLCVCSILVPSLLLGDEYIVQSNKNHSHFPPVVLPLGTLFLKTLVLPSAASGKQCNLYLLWPPLLKTQTNVLQLHAFPQDRHASQWFLCAFLVPRKRQRPFCATPSGAYWATNCLLFQHITLGPLHGHENTAEPTDLPSYREQQDLPA